jgi:hypothetical protein
VASRVKQYRTTYESFETSQSGVMPATSTAELDDIDQAFERLESGAPPPGLPDEGALEDRLAEVENTALFHELAMAHAGPLREFMHELAAGPARKHWLEIARPLVASLLSAIKALDQATLVPAMSSLHAAIDLATRTPGSKIDGGARKALLSAYGRLVIELPCVFDL